MFITVLYEKWDSVVSAYSDHLNVSLLFYRDRYKLDDELLRLDTFSIGDKLERLNLLRHHSAFLISLAHTSKAKLLIREFARDCSIPTIQAQVSSWSGLSKSSFNDGTSLDNFVHLVPAFVVFDNIVHELVQLLNITEFLVLFDKHFDEEVQFEWKKPFVSALKNVHFEPMFTKISVCPFELLAESVALYMQAAIPQFEARHFRNFIVFTKDTLALKCEDCLSANLSWVRMMPNGRVQTLRKFNDFLRQEELEMIYQVPVPTFYETQLSFCLDIMEIATKYLLLTNHSLAKAAKKRPEGFVEWENGQNTSEKGAVTLKRLMQERSLDFEFGRYEFHFGEVYYQAVIGMILKVERRVDEPEVDFHKYIGNWTLEKGIQPLYDNLSVDHEPFIQFMSENINQSPGIERVQPCASTEPVFLDTGQRVEGYSIDLLKMLTNSLNFTYDLYLIEDGKFGSVDENGNWDGMIGDLVLGKAEIAIGPISVLAERENDIDFTVPFYDLVGLSILMKRSDVEYSMFKFLKVPLVSRMLLVHSSSPQVLEWPVWTCILGAYLFTSTLLWVFDRFSPYSYRNNSEEYADETEKRRFTFKECLWFCMTSLTPQGGGEAPKNVSGRLVAATWWLFGFIIIASYTANLAAFLTVSRMEQTINELDDLAKQYKIEYAPLRGGATETYFRRMAEIEENFYNIWKQMSLNESGETSNRAKLAVWDYPVSDKFTNMWRFMQESTLPESVDKAIQRVLESEKGFAFIADAMEIKYAILTNCRLQQVGTEFSRKPYAIAVQTGHVLKESLSQLVLKLQNERKLETCKERWWHQNERRKDCSNSEDDSGGISIENIAGVFIVILAGIGISMVILLFEYIYYSRKGAPEETEKATKRGRDGSGQRNGNGWGKMMGRHLDLETDNVQHPHLGQRHTSTYNNSAFSVD
uniref:Glutamate receptor ionotropic, kainate 2 n=1 Tax=Globodera pallida TaxID=36090 RepID=A0A183C949_GLOPA